MEIKRDNKISEPQKKDQTIIKKINIPPIYPKKKDNRCGTFGLFQLLNYHKKNEQKNPIEPDKINDNQITGFFTAPKTIVDFAKKQGYEARCVSFAKSSEEEAQKQLIKLLENDIPVMIVIRPDPSKPRLLHYVTVNGFEKLNGEVKNYFIVDSWNGQLKCTPKELENFWDNLPCGGSRCMILITPKDKAGLLPPENPHSGYEFMEGVALAEAGAKAEIALYKDGEGASSSNSSTGMFLNLKFNHHLNKDNDIDWNNYVSLYFGKNLNNLDCTFTSNFESFLGKIYKSNDLKFETKSGLDLQYYYNQPWFSETFAGGAFTAQSYGKNFEWGTGVKAGLLNGRPGAAAEVEFDWIIYNKRHPMTLRTGTIFLKCRKSWFLNGEDGNQIIQGGIKYTF